MLFVDHLCSCTPTLFIVVAVSLSQPVVVLATLPACSLTLRCKSPSTLVHTNSRRPKNLPDVPYSRNSMPGERHRWYLFRTQQATRTGVL